MDLWKETLDQEGLIFQFISNSMNAIFHKKTSWLYYGLTDILPFQVWGLFFRGEFALATSRDPDNFWVKARMREAIKEMLAFLQTVICCCVGCDANLSFASFKGEMVCEQWYEHQVPLSNRKEAVTGCSHWRY